MRFLNLADYPVLHEANRQAVMVHRLNLNAHLGDQLSPMRKLGKLADLVKIMRQWFLTIHMLPELQSTHINAGVHVIRRRDIHRINVLRLFVQQFAPVLIDRHVGKFLLKLGRAVQVHLGNCNQLELWKF